MEQDDTSSCGSLSPIWSSNEDNIITNGDESEEACELVQVPEEPNDEVNTFLMVHRDKICSLIQADWPGWVDRFFFTLRHVLEHPGLRVEDMRVLELAPKQSRNTVDLHPQA